MTKQHCFQLTGSTPRGDHAPTDYHSKEHIDERTLQKKYHILCSFSVFLHLRHFTSGQGRDYFHPDVQSIIGHRPDLK